MAIRSFDAATDLKPVPYWRTGNSGAGISIDTNTSILIHGNGANNGTTITDSAPGNLASTVYGNCVTSTAQSKFGGSSIYFDGTNSKFDIANSALWDFAAGDFTVDFWLRPHAAQYGPILFPYPYQIAIYFRYAGANKICVGASSNGGPGWDLVNIDAAAGQGTIALTLDVWSHVAFTRRGNWWMTFVNGIMDVAVNAAGTLYTVNDVRHVGWDGAGWLNGNLQELRVCKGTSYIFTPTTLPTQPYVS